MSASTVKKPDKYQKRVSKFVKVVCKRLQPFRGIFKEKTDPISRNVVSFKNHKVNVVLVLISSDFDKIYLPVFALTKQNIIKSNL